MAIDLEEYKKGRISNLTLPTGLEVTVKEVTPYTLLKVEGELKIKPSEEEIYSHPLVQRLFELFLVKPKIPEEIEISDFSREDYLFLHNLIFEKVTLKAAPIT